MMLPERWRIITGAACFIGYVVARRLLGRGDEVVGVDALSPYDAVTLKEGRVLRLGADRRFRFHLATLADRAEPDRLVMYHHDPMHSDTQLEAMRADVLHRWGVADDRVLLAAEGDTYDL